MSKTKLDRNSTSFQLELNTFLKSAKWDSTYDFLKYYQNITRIYFKQVEVDSRGLLITHQMGLGKSILAIAIAMDAIEAGQAVIVMLTKSLQSNMEGAIRKYVHMRGEHEPNYFLARFPPDELDRWIKRHFSFVSMNASNMLKQVNRAAEGMSAAEIDKVLEARLGELTKMASLDGKLLIVDEAHNLFRAITNGSKNGMGLYDMVMRSKGLKLVFLTGTPITNDPFEVVPCFNMLGGSRIPVLPGNYKDFNAYFVDAELGRIKNKEKFQNRILGLVSNVTHASRSVIESENRAEFPNDLGTFIVRVPMQPEQFAVYQLARDKEKDEGSTGGPGGNKVRFVETPMLVKPKSFSMSSYRVRSRQLSNYCPPQRFRNETDYSKIPPEEISSPKFDKILEDIEAAPGRLHLLYSQFVGTGGLGVFAVYLKHRGWQEVSVTARTVHTDEVRESNDEQLVADEQPISEPVIEGGIMELLAKDPPKDYLTIIEEQLIEAEEPWWDQRHQGFSILDQIDGAADSILRVRMATSDDIDKLEKIKSINFGPWLKQPRAIIVSDNLDAFALADYVPCDESALQPGAMRLPCGVGQVHSIAVNSQDNFYRALFERTVRELVSPKSGAWETTYTVKSGSGQTYFVDTRDAVLGGRDAGTPGRFAIISGSVPQDERDALIKMFNSPANQKGGIIDLLMVSSTGAEGLDPKGIREIYVMEPYWNYARLEQIKYRGIRNDSHKHLPQEDKNVRMRIYLAVAPDKSGHTTDEDLYEESVKLHATNKSFLDAISEVSIECHLNNHTNCRACAPSGRPLCSKDIGFDVKAADPCGEIKEATIRAQEITVDGKKFYYVPNPESVYEYSIFVHDPALNAHRRLAETDPDFLAAVAMITQAAAT